MKTSSTIRSGLTALAGLFLAVSLASTAWANSFSAEQKTEIGEVIKQYLLKNPEILRDAFHELERRETAAKEENARKGIADNAAILYNSKLSHVVGNKDGDITMVEFFDYNCGYCKRAFGDVQAILKSDPKLNARLQ